MEKVKGKLSNGFKFEIDNNVFHDYRFLRAMRKLQTDTDGYEGIDACFEMVEVLFNDRKQEEAFYKYLADKNGGRATVEAVGAALGEIMRIVQEKSEEAKN